ncbi:MAG: DsbA family protein [Chloroflexota bacterium]
MDTNVEIPVIQPEEQTPVVVIPRVLFNYAVIAVVCLVVGIVTGMVAYDRVTRQGQVDTEALINKAVATAVAALPRESGAPDPNVRHEVSIENQPSLGSPDAPVVLVEFGDFHCGYCKRFHEETIAPLLENYGDRVLFVYRDYPILGPDSLQAALAASCAYSQNAFWEFHDRLFANPTQLVRDQFVLYAQDLNLDMDQFTACYDDATLQTDVVQDYNDGVALGITGTPTFFINGKIFVGAQPYAQFAAAIDAELNAATSAQAS